MGIVIPTDEVRKHAREVDEVSRMLDEARGAVSFIRASSNAYGYPVGPLFTSAYLNPHRDEAIASYRRAVVGMRPLADLLRAMANDFDHSDECPAERLRGTR
ncbi:hypothetical protein AFR_08300 [Actinoplanes friuliensis DSM 7358]|uniref:Uncharacterized protein n=1 Tax=Actinoplanes friuliensis DSM 7358 TaxID=1246995 RepID=U5VSV3_9ACTN|nr:hypothetical protein AFR_08300 [Actinoplanes friuliensis DSM 7358]